MLNITINIHSYYAGIMLNAFNDPYAQSYAGIIGGSLVYTHCHSRKFWSIYIVSSYSMVVMGLSFVLS